MANDRQFVGPPPIKDIFPANSPDAVWMISVLCGHNDISEAMSLLGAVLPASNPPRPDANGRLAYRLRLLMSHYFEHYQVLANPPKNNQAIRRLFDAKMPVALTAGEDISTGAYWERLKARMTIKTPELRGLSLIEVLKHTRDVTFHYMEENRPGDFTRIRSGLENVADDRFPIALGFKPNSLEGRWVIADEVRMQFLKTLGFITTDPFDVHLDKFPFSEIGFVTHSLINSYTAHLAPLRP